MEINKIQLLNHYTLTPEVVDLISNDIEKNCLKLNVDRKIISRCRLSVEDSLNVWMNSSDEPVEATLEIGKKLTHSYVKISVNGDAVNPYSHDGNKSDFGTGRNSMLIRIGLVPEYSYSDGVNMLNFRLRRKPLNQLLVLVLIILLSLAVGILGKMFLPDNITTGLSTNIITPIEDTFFRILSSIAGPMIFLSVAWGIYGIGDVYTLGRIGKKMMLAFLKIIFLFSIFGLLFYPLFSPVFTADRFVGRQFSKIFELILSIFPSNIFSPFVEGNTLQIIFLAVIIGMSLIFLGQRTASVAKAVEQINNIIVFLMEIIAKMVPVFVVVVLVNIIWSGALETFSKVWKLAIIFIAAQLSGLILFLLYTSFKLKKNPIGLVRAILPAYLIALTTASSSATFETNMKICTDKFRIKKEFSSFGVPFGMVVFKPTTALYYLFVCFYFSSIAGMETSVSWIITAVITTAISAVATPPIPGGAAASYSIMFIQLGIPVEYIAVGLAIDMLFDFVLTAGDMYLLLLEQFNLASKLGMIEKTKKLSE